MATAVKERERLVSQPDQSVLFMSRREELRLTMRKRFPIRDQSGEIVGRSEGEFVAFRGNRFVCPMEGDVLLVDSLDGGEATVDAAGLIERLKKHRLFGNVWEGFWLVNPVAPPPSQEEMDRLMAATADWNVETLEEILRQERDGWARADVISSAESAIERVTANEARIRAEIEAENAAAAAEKPARGSGKGEGPAKA